MYARPPCHRQDEPPHFYLPFVTSRWKYHKARLEKTHARLEMVEPFAARRGLHRFPSVWRSHPKRKFVRGGLPESMEP